MFLHLFAIPLAGSLIDIDGTVFIQFAIFMLMFGFLHLALFRPVLRLIEARREATVGARARAGELREEARILSEDVDARIAETRRMLNEERDGAIEQAKLRARNASAGARNDSHAMLTEARDEMIQRAGVVRAELSVEMQDLARTLASRILGRQL